MLSRRLFPLVLLLACCQLASDAKTWTVDDRQTKLMQDINQGQKSGELTLKEAHDLRKLEAGIARKKARMKAKGRGVLTDDDLNDLEKDLNKVSVDLNQYKLEKRVTQRKDDAK